MNEEFRQSLGNTQLANRVLRGQPALPRDSSSIHRPSMSEEREIVLHLFKQQRDTQRSESQRLGQTLLTFVYQWIANRKSLKTTVGFPEEHKDVRLRKGWHSCFRITYSIDANIYTCNPRRNVRNGVETFAFYSCP